MDQCYREYRGDRAFGSHVYQKFKNRFLCGFWNLSDPYGLSYHFLFSAHGLCSGRYDGDRVYQRGGDGFSDFYMRASSGKDYKLQKERGSGSESAADSGPSLQHCDGLRRIVYEREKRHQGNRCDRQRGISGCELSGAVPLQSPSAVRFPAV